MGDNNEENILKAFALGAQEVMAQKREPQDVILLGEPSKQHNNQMLIGIHDGDSDDDFAGSVPLYQNITQKKASYLDEKAEIKKEKDAIIGKQNNLGNNTQNPTHADDKMFLKKEDLEENGNPAAFAKPAGIYLEKDEELEKMKAIYEGQAGGLTMAQQQTQIAKKKKQQQQQQQQQLQKEKEKENQTKVAKLKKTDFKYDKSKVVKNLINDEEELGEIGEWIEATANKAKKVKNDKDSDGEDADSEEEQKNEADDDDFNYDEEDIQKHKEQQKKQMHKDNDDFIEEEEDDPENQEANIPLSSSQQQRQKSEQLALTKQKQEIANKKLQQQSILNHRGGPIANRLQDKAKFIELTHNSNSNNAETKKNNNNLESNNQNQQINENSKNTQNSLGGINPSKEETKNSNQGLAQSSSNNTKMSNVLLVGMNQVDEPPGSKPAVSDNDEDEQYWKAINAKTKSEQQKISLHIDPKNDSANKREISFIESWQELKMRNLSDLKKGIQVDSLENQSIIDKLFGMCGLSHSNLSSVSLMDERDQLFAIAKMPFTDADPLHFKMLSSVFFALKENYNCGRTGSHWESIGFQGVNPASDLRGVGMLGVLQMLALTSQHLPFARYALKYSTHPTYQFPLAATLLNITNIVLNTAREQKLNGLINQEKSVVSVLNNFFFATFYFFFIEYQKSQMTFNLVGNHLKNIEASVKLSPKKTLDDFKASIQLFYKQHDSSA